MLRTWCEAQYGRQSEVARILGVHPTAVAHWFSGRRKMTGEQSLRVQEFLRTVYGTTHEPVAPTEAITPPSLAYDPDDSIRVLHNSLENRTTKTLWVRSLGDYHHIIVGGPIRDIALNRIIDLLKSDKKLADIIARK
jgi:DNA-binding transcriptional regulator YdaS (Cro superfamily)